MDYYTDFFTTSRPEHLEEVVDVIPKVVKAEMNADLIGDFTAMEVEVTLKQMAPLKAPGPDGMPPLFYKNYWTLLGNDVTQSVLYYLNSGSLLATLGHSFVTLIPKVKNPEFVSQFRSINLRNVLYKVFSKVLENRMKKIMPQLISEHQSAFHFDRLISDNIMVAFETLHYMRDHCAAKTRYMTLKLDMSKVYDRVEWEFIKKVMRKMGFDNQWVIL